MLRRHVVHHVGQDDGIVAVRQTRQVARERSRGRQCGWDLPHALRRDIVAVETAAGKLLSHTRGQDTDPASEIEGLATEGLTEDPRNVPGLVLREVLGTLAGHADAPIEPLAIVAGETIELFHGSSPSRSQRPSGPRSYSSRMEARRTAMPSR